MRMLPAELQSNKDAYSSGEGSTRRVAAVDKISSLWTHSSTGGQWRRGSQTHTQTEHTWTLFALSSSHSWALLRFYKLLWSPDVSYYLLTAVSPLQGEPQLALITGRTGSVCLRTKTTCQNDLINLCHCTGSLKLIYQAILLNSHTCPGFYLHLIPSHSPLLHLLCTVIFLTLDCWLVIYLPAFQKGRSLHE